MSPVTTLARRSARASWLLSLALAGCGGGSWQLAEPARVVVARVSQRDTGLILEWPAGLPGDSVALLRDATRVLDDAAARVMDLERRQAQALTEEERARLAELRNEGIERLFTDLSQLHTAIGWWLAPGTRDLAVVLEPADEARGEPDARRDPRGRAIPGSGSLRFAYLSALEPHERPDGPALRKVSLPLALRLMRDAMVAWARAKGALSEESKAALGPG